MGSCLSLGVLFLLLPLAVVELVVGTPVMLALGTPLSLDQETQPGECCELVLRLPFGPRGVRASSRGGLRAPFLGLGGFLHRAVSQAVLRQPCHRRGRRRGGDFPRLRPLSRSSSPQRSVPPSLLRWLSCVTRR